MKEKDTKHNTIFINRIVELPHNREYEDSLICLSINYPKQYIENRERIKDSLFYQDKHKNIINAIKSVSDNGNNIDVVTVANEYKKYDSENGYYEIAKIAGLLGNSPSNYTTYLNELERLSKLRSTIFSLQKGLTQCTDEFGDPNEIVNSTKEELETIICSGKSDICSMTDVVENNLMQIVQDNRNPNIKHRGTLTGFAELDDKGGLLPGNLIVIAASSSQGKTSLALSIVRNALRCNEPIAFYSMEMTKEELTARLVSMESGISSYKILYKRLNDYENKEVNKAFFSIRAMGRCLYYDDKSNSSIDNILASIRTMAIKNHIKGVVVDYLQIASLNTKGNANREQVTAEIARRLKNIAKELGIWVIALSQLSRDREKPEPSIDRLRDSGQIVEASDVVMLLYRPEAIEGVNLSYPDDFKDKSTKGTALIRVAKGRNIGLCSFIVGFQQECTLFYPLERIPESNQSNAVVMPF